MGIQQLGIVLWKPEKNRCIETGSICPVVFLVTAVLLLNNILPGNNR